MTKHRLHYIDMRPQPIEPDSSSIGETVLLWFSAALAVAAIYLATVILFSF
jgi:hypothetical protein